MRTKSLSAAVVEAPPSIRWHLSRLRMPLLRHAFAQIGVGSVLVRPHTLKGVDRIHIGDNCAIFDEVWLQCEPDKDAAIRIGNRTYLGHQVHVHSINAITIGDDCVIADGAMVTSADHGRQDRKTTAGTGAIRIGDRVFIGQRAIVLGGVAIGDGATVGAHAVVTRDVPPGATVVGVPARVVGADS